MVGDVLPVLYPVNQDDDLPFGFHPFKLRHIIHVPTDRVHPAEKPAKTDSGGSA